MFGRSSTVCSDQLVLGQLTQVVQDRAGGHGNRTLYVLLLVSRFRSRVDYQDVVLFPKLMQLFDGNATGVIGGLAGWRRRLDHRLLSQQGLVRIAPERKSDRTNK